ncbi:hypothetical protein K435DRAFT_869526 [Dendrothele bispora CBS 962.96]|uniref:Mid2 domain-containing protein n=1 Tax=Dendrothele bispora (strain CBS 962.96) TaxID=1314807 RepID=A0A4S8L9E0_DENBC|nr:hypothetical protein K435DRAFT_869526 [Dendrothele bispora CBS 962.96]
MALWYWLAALLYSSLAWGMDIAAPASTVTTGQPATVSWTIEPQDQLSSLVGIFIIPDGNNVDTVVAGLVSDKTWNQYLVDKNSHSGTLSLVVTQPGRRVFYFGGFTASDPFGLGGSNNSDHNDGNGKPRRKKARQLPSIQELGRSNLVTAVAPGSTAKSPDPSSPSEETQPTPIQTTLSSPDASIPLGKSISSSSPQEKTTTIHSEVNQSHTTVVTLRSGSQTLTLTSDNSNLNRINCNQLGEVNQVFLPSAMIVLTIILSGTTATETVSNTVSGSSATPLGVILGSVFGALGFLVVLTLIIFWLLRRKNPPQQSPPVSTGRDQNDELVSRLRWGNLKLQQRLATRGGHSLLQQDDSEIEEHRRRVRVHTDSGWRMEAEQQDVASNDLNEMELEVPPDYTEA